MRVLTDPVDTGAVVLSLPQDVQSHAFDFPAEFFAERDWVIRRPMADPDEVQAVARLLAAARKPIIIAGGGVVYSDATAELEALAGSAGIPVLETMAGKGAVQQKAWWQIGGIGLEGTPANNDLVRQADFVLTVGSRLTDFPTASQSLFENPDVVFASINVNGYDAQRLGATGIVGDAKRALRALADEVGAAGFTSPQEWQDQVRAAVEGWEPVRAAALDPDTPFDRATIPADFGDIVPDTGALLTQGQVIGLMQEHARAGDTIVAAAGGPPGDVQKVWDATEGRYAHLEFGFSCMGYEIPAGMGVRLADPNPDSRVVVFIGDGTFLMSPTELVTAAQESIAVTVVIPENRGYQVIHRLQMGRHGTEFGNEFRYRTSPLDLTAEKNGSQPRLDGDYLEVDLVQVAQGLGAREHPGEHRRRGARGARRDPRPPGPGRHRRPGDPAHRPARCRRVVGRRPVRGVGGRDRPAPAHRVRGRAVQAALVRLIRVGARG